MLKPLPCFILILALLSFALTSSCKTLLAKERTLTTVETIQLKPVSSPAINIESVYDIQKDSLQDHSISWLNKNIIPIISIIALLVILSLYRLYLKEKSSKYIRPLSFEALSLIQVIKDNASRVFNSLVADQKIGS